MLTAMPFSTRTQAQTASIQLMYPKSLQKSSTVKTGKAESHLPFMVMPFQLLRQGSPIPGLRPTTRRWPIRHQAAGRHTHMQLDSREQRTSAHACTRSSTRVTVRSARIQMYAGPLLAGVELGAPLSPPQRCRQAAKVGDGCSNLKHQQ